MRNKLRHIRINKNLTQKELSEKIGVTQQQISLYEKGDIFPSMRVALKIAKELEVTLDEIFLPINTN